MDLFRKAADVRKEDFQRPMLLAQSLPKIGRTHEAAEKANRALSLGSVNLFRDGQAARAGMVAAIARALSRPHDHDRECRLPLLAGRRQGTRARLPGAPVRARLGKRDWVEGDSDYDMLRDDPRFKKLIARLK